MKTENIIELLRFILDNQKLTDENIFKIIDVLFDFLKNKSFGYYECQVREHDFNFIISPLFERYLADWIYDYDDLDERINELISYRKENKENK